MNFNLPRLSARLAIPAIALCALFALGEPIPTNAANPADAPIVVSVDTSELVVSIREDVDAMEAKAARSVAHQAASRLRWAMTLPAAGGGKRCLVDTCGG